jgi:hypothetical protein
MPTPKKDILVTDKMGAFCARLLEGTPPTRAATLAGYDDPKAAAAVLLRHPQVRKALTEGTAARIECELVPLSLKVARDILEDTNPKAVAVRAKLAVAMLDRAAKNAQAEADPAKELAKMSLDELAALVAKGREAVALEARTVDVTPRYPPPGVDHEAHS